MVIIKLCKTGRILAALEMEDNADHEEQVLMAKLLKGHFVTCKECF